MNFKPISHRTRFVSIRLKLLLSFTILFSGVFAIAFYWFYNFSTEKAMKRVFDDMQSTALGTAAKIDLDVLLELYADGEPAPDGETVASDPRYKAQLQWFKTVNELEPRAWPYTFVLIDEKTSPQASAIVPGEILSLPPEDRPQLGDTNFVRSLPEDAEPLTVFLADLWIYYDLSKTARLLEISTASEYTLRAYREGTIVNRPLYNDKQFGRWISTYVPLKDEQGNTLAILGVDFEADYVHQVQAAIRNRVLVAFLITYASLFTLVYFLANLFAKPITQLTGVAEQIGEGNYENNLKSFSEKQFADELTILANVFSMMTDKVRLREENLKQQVARLKIEIDESKRDTEVKQITESEFFQDLRSKVIELRQRRLTTQQGDDKTEQSDDKQE